MYKIFAHTADAGFQVEAVDLNMLFADAGQALFSLIVANLADVQTRTRTQFKIDGCQLDYLLVNWLSELLFTFESQRLLFSQFDVSIGRDGLEAVAVGETIDESRHRLDHEVKAITYHGLSVEQTQQKWTAQVIVDI